MKKIFLFLTLLLLVLSQKSSHGKKEGKKPKVTDYEDMDFLQYLKKINQFREMILENPDEFDKIAIQFSIKSDEQIITEVIYSHIIDYQFFVNEQENNDQDIKIAQENLDNLIKYIFKKFDETEKIKKYHQLFEQEYLKERVPKKQQDLNELIKQTDLDIKNVSQTILGFIEYNIEQKNVDKFDQYILSDELTKVIERIMDYYEEERGYDEEQLDMFRQSKENLGSVGFYIQQYLQNEDFQDLIDDLLEGDIDIEDLFELMLEQSDSFNTDSKEWKKIAKKADKFADKMDIDLDTEDIEDMIEEYKEQQEYKQKQKERQEKEMNNRKHDSTITIFLGVIFVGVLIFFVFRYYRQKKLQSNLIQRQGYQQENL